MLHLPQQVNEPPHPGPVAVIADCPDASYLASLRKDPAWAEFQVPGTTPALKDQKKVDVVVHLAHAQVICRYPQQFLNVERSEQPSLYLDPNRKLYAESLTQRLSQPF